MLDKHDIQIRYAEISDAKALSSLIIEVIQNDPLQTSTSRSEESSYYSSEHVYEKISDDLFFGLLAFFKGRLAGFLLSEYDHGLIWISWIGVREDFRGKNISQFLLETLKASLTDRRAHKIWSDVRVENIAMQRMFEKSGFLKINRFDDHWYRKDYFTYAYAAIST